MTDILSKGGYVMSNKTVIKKYGNDAAILLGELCSKYTYWYKKSKLQNNYCFSTRKDLEENTGLTKHKQRNAMKILIDAEIIQVESRGKAITLWYTINVDKLDEIVSSKEAVEDKYEPLITDKNKSALFICSCRHS